MTQIQFYTKAQSDAGFQPLAANLTSLAAVVGSASLIPYFTALATIATLTLDTDGTMAANSDTRVASQKAIVTYVASQVGGGLPLLSSSALIMG